MIYGVNPEVIIELFLICITGLPYIIFFLPYLQKVMQSEGYLEIIYTESNPQTGYKHVAFRLLSQRGYDSAKIGY